MFFCFLCGESRATHTTRQLYNLSMPPASTVRSPSVKKFVTVKKKKQLNFPSKLLLLSRPKYKNLLECIQYAHVVFFYFKKLKHKHVFSFFYAVSSELLMLPDNSITYLCCQHSPQRRAACATQQHFSIFALCVEWCTSNLNTTK